MCDLDDAAWAEVRRLYETSDLSVREIARRYKISMGRIYQRRAVEVWPMRSETTPEMIAAAEARYARGVENMRAKAAAERRRLHEKNMNANGGGGSVSAADQTVCEAAGEEAASGSDDATAENATATRRNRRTAGKRNGRGARYGRPVGTRAMGREALLSRMVRLAERNLAIMETHMESENGHITAEERERSTRTVGTLVKTLEKVTELSPGNDDASAASSVSAEATAELRRELAERLYRMWGGAKR